MPENTDTSPRPIPDEVADRVDALVSSVRVLADVIEDHLDDCPVITDGEAAMGRGSCARLRSVHRPVSGEAEPEAFVEAFVEVEDEVAFAVEVLQGHSDHCPAKAS